MIVQRVYFDGKTVKRIYQNGEVIWMLGGGRLSLEHISSIMSDGFHAIHHEDALILYSDEQNVSAQDGDVDVLNAITLNSVCDSATKLTEWFEACPAVVFTCNAKSMTREEVNALVATAISYSHTEDQGTGAETSALVAGAVDIAHQEDMATTADVISANIADASSLSFQEGNGLEHQHSMLTVESDSVISLGSNVESELHTEESMDVVGITEIASRLHIVTVCKAYLSVSTAADLNMDETSATTTEATMQFQDGDAENENFIDLYVELIIADEEGTVFLEVDGIDYPLENTSDPIKMGVDDIYTIEII